MLAVHYHNNNNDIYSWHGSLIIVAEETQVMLRNHNSKRFVFH